MNTPPQWPLTLYYDGSCPLCAREIRLLRQRAARQRLQLVDISQPGFQASALGLTQQALQERLHAHFADGQWLTGLDATLWSWRAAGMGAWAAPLTWRPLRPLFELGYRLFCRLRLHLDGLPHPDAAQRCKDKTCSNRERR